MTRRRARWALTTAIPVAVLLAQASSSSAFGQGLTVEMETAPGHLIPFPTAMALSDDGTQAFHSGRELTAPPSSVSVQRWRLGREVEALPDVAGYIATCANGLGTATGGSVAAGSVRHMARWDEGAGFVDSGVVGASSGFTADGGSAFGWIYGNLGRPSPARWPYGSAPQVIFDASPGTSAYPVWMSNDGSRVVGYTVDIDGHTGLWDGIETFVWEAPGTTTTISTGQYKTTVADVSEDGLVLVGSTGPDGYLVLPTPFIWREGLGFDSLGALPTGWEGAGFRCVSGDGSLAAGWYREGSLNKVFLWTAAGGFVPLFGAATGIADPLPGESWELVDMSSDGQALLIYASLSARSFIVYRSPPPSNEIGEGTCVPPSLNSAGLLGVCTVEGTGLIEYNDLVLRAQDLPPSQFGLFILGTEEASIPLANGLVCITGSIGRLRQSIASSGAQGTLSFAPDLGLLPIGNPTRPAMPGETLHFQAWYRDTPAAGDVNLTSAVKVFLR